VTNSWIAERGKEINSNRKKDSGRQRQGVKEKK